MPVESKILLSVLIPSLPERLRSLTELLDVLRAQDDPQMEVIVMMDNRRRWLGEKRNAMMDLARGKYLCHIDDDDLVAPDFFRTLRPAMEGDYDLIAYDATCSLNGAPPFRVVTRLGAENEQPKHLPGGRYSDIIRQPWQWCLWRTEFARRFRFPERYAGDDDWQWLKQALPEVQRYTKVEEALYHHRYDAHTTTF